MNRLDKTVRTLVIIGSCLPLSEIRHFFLRGMSDVLGSLTCTGDHI